MSIRLIAVAGSLLLPIFACAATVVVTVPLPTIQGFSGGISFPAFDMSLGTLTAARFDVSGSDPVVYQTGSLVGEGDIGFDPAVGVTAQLVVDIGATAEFGDGSTWYATNGVTRFTSNPITVHHNGDRASWQVNGDFGATGPTITSPYSLSKLTNNGGSTPQIGLLVGTANWLQVPAGGTQSWGWANNYYESYGPVSGVVTGTYTYTPVPEPSALPMLLAGVIFAVAGNRRARKHI